MKQFSLLKLNGFLKFAFAVTLLVLSAQRSLATATPLATGDIALLGVNADNPDKFSVILLKDIGSGTIIQFTDNGFSSTTAGRTGENYLTFTAPSDLKTGTILTWTNGMTISGTGWSSNNPTNFSFNASGDQLFIFQGTADDSHWTSQSGITLLYGINYGAALLTSGTAAASSTYKPSATKLDAAYFVNFPSGTANDLYYAAGSSSSTKVSLFGTASSIMTELTTTSKFFTDNAVLTFPIYIFGIGTLASVNTTYGTASTSPTSFQIGASGLSANIALASLSGFEFSTSSGGTYSSTLSLTQTSGLVSNTVFVRLAALTDVGTYSGNLVFTSSNAQTLNVATVSSTVSAKTLTIGTPSIASKQYNGTKTAGAVNVGVLSATGVGSPQQTLGVSATAADYSSADAGTYNNVTITYTLSNGTNGGKGSNYTLANGTASGTITPKTLTIGTPTIASKQYDGTKTAGVLTVGALSGTGVGNPQQILGVVSGSAADYISADASITPYSSAIIYTLTDGTGANAGKASNYTLANGTASGIITPKTLTIGTPSIASRPYDGTKTAGAVTVGALSGLVGTAPSQETLGISGSAADYSSADAATYNNVAITYILSNGSNGGKVSNYTLVNGTASGTIAQRELIITAKDTSKTYGDVLEQDLSSIRFTSVGLQNNETIGTVTMDHGTGAAADAIPNTYIGQVIPSTATGGTFSAGNYDIHYTVGNIIVSTAITNWKTGNSNPSWSIPTNWSNGLPGQYIKAIVSTNAIPYPELKEDVSAYDIFLDPSAIIDIGANNLTLNGSITGEGTLSGSTLSTLTVVNDHLDQTLRFTSNADTLYGLTLSDNAEATISEALKLASRTHTAAKLTLGSSSILYTGNGLTLVSNDSSTAIVAPIPVNNDGIALGEIRGKVTVQRYIRSSDNVPYDNGSNTVIGKTPKRAWHLMTAPFKGSGSQSIFNAWQQGGLLSTDQGYQAGSGTYITGTDLSNGLDAGMNGSYSLKILNVAANPQRLDNVSNTNVPISKGTNGNADNTGYFIFVRGDRDPKTLGNPNFGEVLVNNTTLSANGELQTGDQIFSSDNGQMSALTGRISLIGDPFASPINFQTIHDQGGLNNVRNIFYVWDPNIGSVGGYVSIDDADGDGSYTKNFRGVIGIPPNATDADLSIQSSQAFFVLTDANGPASITIKESSKTSLNNNLVYRPVGAPTDQYLISGLYYVNNDNSESAVVGNTALYNTGVAYDPAVTNGDVPYFTNTLSENFSLIRSGRKLGVERRPVIRSTDTLFYNITYPTPVTPRNYRLIFTDSIPDHPGMEAWLKDGFTGDSSKLAWYGTTRVNFSVTDNVSSQTGDRFMVVFRPEAPVPVTFTSVQAQQQAANKIMVQWNVTNQLNIKGYEVERSTDGKIFGKATSVNAITGGNDLQYNWSDGNATESENYYRIKSIGIDGDIEYSKVVNVKINSVIPAISIYQNPVKNNLIQLRFDNVAKGTYRVVLHNTMGQKIVTDEMIHDGTNGVKSLLFNKKIAKGVYQLTFSSLKYTAHTINVVFE